MHAVSLLNTIREEDMALEDLRGPQHWTEWAVTITSLIVFSILGWSHLGIVGSIVFPVIGYAAILFMLN